MWTERDIREQTDEQTFYRGKLLESTNGVLEFSSFETEGVYGDKELNLRATIHGTNKNNYKVEVTLYYDEYGEPQDIDYYCPCEDFLTSDGICKHCVATILYYMHTDGQSKTVTSPFSMPLPFASEYDDRDTFYGNTSSVFSENSTVSQESIWEHPARTDNSMQQILRQFGNQENWMITDGALIGRIHLEPTLDISGKTPSVSLRIGDKKMYVVKSIPELVQHVQQTEMHKYGKNLAFVHQLDAFDDNSRSLMSFFIRHYQDYNYWYSTDIRNFTLKNELLDAFIEIVADSGTMLEPSTKNQGLWYLTDEEYKKTLTLTAVEGGLELKLEQIPSVSSLDWNYIFKDQKIYHSSRHTHQAINLFEDRMTGWCGGKSFIAESDLPLFAREMLPELEKKYYIVKEHFYPENYLPEDVSFRLYLDLPQRDIITCDLVADYENNREYHVFQTDSKKQHRNIRQEAKVAALLSGYCNAKDDATGLPAIVEDNDKLYDFLTRGLAECEKIADVYISDRLKKIQVIQPPKVSLGVSLNGNLLDFNMEAEGMSLEQLAFLLSKYNRKRNYYRLKSGQFVAMEESSLDTLAQLSQGLMLTEEQLASGHISLPKFRALYLDAQLRDNESLPVNKSREFRELIRNMKTVEDSDFEVPDAFRKILREYQKKGYLWLATLCSNGFGGILADDMGLGKTLQVIVFLYDHYIVQGENNRNTLIVCPASLVYNWAQECQHFAPELPVCTVAGTAAERRELLDSLPDHPGQILITSYDLLRRDIEQYQNLTFDYQIIDEAQFIKNATTKAAQAVKQINSRFRLALTGTPVENRLGELWSIFDYLMPGYLFSYSRFREELELPIIQQQDEDALHRIQKMIAPFILRRLKKDVLKDLPEKLEKNMYAKMTGEQQDLYQAHIQRLQILLSKQSPEEFDRSRIQILSELTKLRQLCCDPALLYEKYTSGSAKLDLCLDLIRNAMESGHKMLVFSQFTTMLDRIAERLQKEHIPYFMLTGATTKQERIRLVTEFNQDETPVFLISLKAGGTGLNLTAADIVIHFDPWWNTAVQNQATDRVHRIGQTNRVLVYKLIAQNSIEENIVKLQEQKAELAEQILGCDNLGSPSFSREELLELLQ
ncbi:SNF2 helicase associated domain-containing protein [Eubacterium ramulus]